MSDLLWRKPRLLALAILLISVAGISALQVLPRAEDPELTRRFANVHTFWPGADAERIEALVTEPLEDALREIEEIKDLISTSLAGSSTINLELADDVGPEEVASIWSRTRDELAEAARELPTAVTPPELVESEIDAYALIFGLTYAREGDTPLAVLGRHAEDLADVLLAVGGTKEVEVFGEPEEEIVVAVDPNELAARGITLARVAAAIEAADAKVAAGRVHGRRNDLLLEVSGELDSLERIEGLPVTSGDDGEFVRVGDLGRVSKQPREPAPTIARISGRPGVAVAARVLGGRRVDLWNRDAKAAVAAWMDTLPIGVEITTLFEQSRYTDRRLEDLFWNFLTGAGLVAVVVLVTMGWRSALLVGSALPLTSLMVLSALRLMDVPIHQMSVTGLVIALGLMIDNAIVMVDEVNHRLERGRGIGASIRGAVRAMFGPLLGSTATTIFAFLPIALMPGPAGEFVGSIAISVILALISSLTLALTVTPALAGWLQRFGHDGRPRPVRHAGDRAHDHRPAPWWRSGWTPRPLAKAWRAGIGAVVRVPALGLVVAVAIPIFGFSRFGELEEQFFPPADRDQFQVELLLPWQTPTPETLRRAELAREVILEHPRVVDVHWFVGESAPRFYYNIVDGRRGTAFYAQALVQLDGPEDSIAVVADLQERLDAALPDLVPLARAIEQGPPVPAPIEIRIFGPDLDRLRAIGLELREVLAGLPGVVHSRATMEDGQPKLMVRLDEEQARLVGLDNRTIAADLLARTDGILGGSLVEDTEELPVRVRFTDAARGDTGAIEQTELATGTGAWTPLSALGDTALVAEDAAIPHRDGRRCNTIQGYVVAGTLPSAVVTRARAALAERGFELPVGYELEWGGEAAERDEAVGNLLATAVILMVLMLASLVLSFDSFRMAATIAGVGVLSIGYALLALWMWDVPFGFMAIVGTMGLIGVAVNDSIVVLAGLARDEHARAGDRGAIVDVVMRATRHLVSTSVTTMVGFAPLLIGGNSFWPPLAIAIAGGVAGATILAITWTPAMFVLLVAPRPKRAERLREQRPGAPTVAPA